MSRLYVGERLSLGGREADDKQHFLGFGGLAVGRSTLPTLARLPPPIPCFGLTLWTQSCMGLHLSFPCSAPADSSQKGLRGGGVVWSVTSVD